MKHHAHVFLLQKFHIGVVGVLLVLAHPRERDCVRLHEFVGVFPGGLTDLLGFLCLVLVRMLDRNLEAHRELVKRVNERLLVLRGNYFLNFSKTNQLDERLSNVFDSFALD